MSAPRQLPDELAAGLRAARRVEAAAMTHAQRRTSIAGTSALMRDAVDAGWQAVQVAAAVGMKAPAVRRRVTRVRGVGHRSGLDVPTPTRKPDPMRNVLETPLDDRQWLTAREALEYANVSIYTLRNWRTAGLLPNSHKLKSNRVLYLRADLTRVMHAPQYKNHGADYSAVLAEVRAAGV